MQATINLRLLGALLFLSVAAPASKNFVTVVSPPVIAQYGQPTILPCWLDPPQSAEGLEIRWYRDEDYDTPVILYQNKKFISSVEGDTGRVTLGLKDPDSKGLDAGDMTLTFSNVTIKDEGNYTCYVSSDEGYDRGRVGLRVRKTGSHPVLSVKWLGENQANVSCKSDGWYPHPRLRWSDPKQELAPRSLLHSSAPSGQVSVQSWVVVSGSSRVSCSVRVSEESVKEAIIHLQGNLPVDEGSGSLSGWLAFCALLLLVLAILAAVFLKKRVCRRTKHKREESEQVVLLPEMEKLLPTGEFLSCHENIKLEDTGNKFIIVKDAVIVRDQKDVQFPDGKEVTFYTAIKGVPGFSEGKHYWEVSLQAPNLDVKKSWWVGLTNAKNLNEFCKNGSRASGDYWFLASSPDCPDSLQLRTRSHSFRCAYTRPQKVGVYLDCDSKHLFFYDVENNIGIAHMKMMFTGEVFPLFNPGKGDQSPMRILDKAAEDASTYGSYEVKDENNINA